MDPNQENVMAMEYNARGKMLYQAEHYEEALAYFQKAEECDPMNREIYLNQGECLIMLDRFDEAENAYQKILLIQKNDGEAYFHLGNIAILKNNVAEGREFYARAINAGFDDPQLYVHTGYMQLESGAYEDAVANFNKALARDKFLPEAWLNKAKAYLSLGRNEEAMQALDSMIQYTPEIFEGHHYKLMLQIQNGKLIEAHKTADNMLRMFPDDEAVRYDKLIMLEAEGDAKAALAYYSEAFAESENPLHLLEKAKILTGIENRSGEALALMEKISAGGHQEISQQAQFFCVIIAMSLGDLKKACSYCDPLLDASQKDENYYSALYFKAYTLDLLGDKTAAAAAYDKAIAELRMASAKAPDKMDYYIMRTMALKNMGKHQQALDLLNYLLMLNPEMQEALFIRSELYKEMHMEAEAAEDMRKLHEHPGKYSPVLNLLKK